MVERRAGRALFSRGGAVDRGRPAEGRPSGVDPSRRFARRSRSKRRGAGELSAGDRAQPRLRSALARTGCAFCTRSATGKARSTIMIGSCLSIPTMRPLSDELAWRLCTCPDARYRDYRRAAELARRAVALAAGDSKYWNTLALALYRVARLAGLGQGRPEVDEADGRRRWWKLAAPGDVSVAPRSKAKGEATLRPCAAANFGPCGTARVPRRAV